MAKSPEMQKLCDQLAGAMFGRTLSEALADKVCVECGKSVLVWSTGKGGPVRGELPIGPDWAFRDDCSRREYKISGLCQACQDKAFSDPEEPEDPTGECGTCGALPGEPHRFMCPEATEGV